MEITLINGVTPSPHHAKITALADEHFTPYGGVGDRFIGVLNNDKTLYARVIASGMGEFFRMCQSIEALGFVDIVPDGHKINGCDVIFSPK